MRRPQRDKDKCQGLGVGDGGRYPALDGSYSGDVHGKLQLQVDGMLTARRGSMVLPLTTHTQYPKSKAK